jgi:hypothetical protein
MLAQMSFRAETIFLLALAVFALQLFHRLQSSTVRTKTVSIQDDLYKMSRLTGSSEYDIFCKSAEEWPAITESMVNKHFKDYLLNELTPYYVNGFVRKHKSQLDDLELPPF